MQCYFIKRRYIFIYLNLKYCMVMACTRTPASQFGFPEHDIEDFLKIGQSHNDEENSLT